MKSTKEVKEKKYTLEEFIYCITKNVAISAKYTKSEIANIIGKAMVSFFDDSNTPY